MSLIANTQRSEQLFGIAKGKRASSKKVLVVSKFKPTYLLFYVPSLSSYIWAVFKRAVLTKADYQDLVAHIILKLQQSKILRKRRWALKQVGGARTEEARFTHLKSTADTIYGICVEWDISKDKLGAATTRMVYNPEQSLSSAFLEKPDIKTNAQFVLVTLPIVKAGERVNAPITDIASVRQFRKSSYSSDLADIEVDIVAAASHILYCDPACCSITVFTIMGRKITFWHFLRSHIAVAYFDYHKHPENFICFLIFMMFASRKELGYDPTVTRVLDAEGKTQGDNGLKTFGQTQTIKASWKFKRKYLIPFGNWTRLACPLKNVPKIALDVAVEFNSVPKHNFCVMYYSASNGYGHKYILRQPLPLQARTHRRVVFKEECQCFDKLSNYADIALRMAQLVQGLEYMCLAGYLHHDINLGNCLFLVSQRQLKISDLEFARPYNVPYTEEGFTGTPGFMAVEYEKGMHSFNNTKENPAREPFFRYNFAHNLKAALWIYVWFLATGVSSDRCGFVTDVARKAVAKLYERVPEGAVLVAGLSCFDVLKRMYQNIKATEPLDPDIPNIMRWNPKFFERRYYQCLYDGFMDIHARLAGVKREMQVEEDKMEDDENENNDKEVNDEMEGDNDNMEGDSAEMEEDKKDIDNPSKRLHLLRLPTPQGVEVV
ncbi:hypothetical protein CPB85DRAFT_1252581 [Mucidula mucida]|nr:hypothetical protein CPB85DRAFT_1252581 [Mucidula mucida]